MKIGLLLCDHIAERFQPIAGDYEQMFRALCAEHFALRVYDTINGELPADLAECDGYLATGSRFSAYDEALWIAALKDFIRRLSAAQKPFVGICFGHQVLAEALGGKVANTGWGAGIHDLTITQSENWMQPPQALCRLHYMHQDQVVQLPPHAVTLGSSAHCPIAMYRVAQFALGIQAHPEFTSAYSAALLHDRAERIGATRTQAALASLAQATDAALLARWIHAFFAQSHQP